MRMLALLAAGLFVGTLMADDKKGKSKDEEAILGTWKAEKLDLGLDLPTPPNYLDKVRLTFKKGGKMISTTTEGTPAEGEFKIDPTAKQKTLDFTFEGMPKAGLYELDGDTLKICMMGAEKERPTELKPDAKKHILVVTFKRVKDEKGEEKKGK